MVYILYHLRYFSFCFSLEIIRDTHYKWGTHRFFVHETFIEPTMLSHIESLV